MLLFEVRISYGEVYTNMSRDARYALHVSDLIASYNDNGTMPLSPTPPKINMREFD